MPEILVVFLAALATAVATGLGALPFAFAHHPPRRWLGLANALAAGLMVAASLSLLVEGVALSWLRTAIGGAFGLVLIRLCHHVIERHGEPDFGALKGAGARQALLIVGVMTLHSFAEGVGVGVAFGGGAELGEFISAAIAIHNVPEGLAISLVLVPKGVSVAVAAWWSIFSSLPQPVMAVPAYLFVTWFAPFLPIGFGLAAGAMLWMAFAELLPDARAEAPLASVVLVCAAGAVLMFGFQELVLR